MTMDTIEATTAAPVDHPPGDYAIVELFGHSTLVGRVSEVERFGAKMLAIEPLFKNELLPPVLHGGAAIYRFTQCSAAVAFARQPQHEYQLPAAIRAVAPIALLAAPEPAPIDDDDDDHGEGDRDDDDHDESL
jgi:hypothetical protein